MFVSTRGTSRHSFREMLFTGYCDDGGILMPEHLPPLGDVLRWRGLPFGLLAFEVIKLFCPEEEIAHDVLRPLVENAYDNFGHKDVVNVVPLDKGLGVAELYHGPSHAFKDLAMQVMGPLLNYVVEEKKRHAVCLIVTTGDTGPSVIEALKDCSAISTIVMYPRTNPPSVSRTQELQMISQTSKNVRVVATQTNPDENDEAVYNLFADAGFRKEHGLTTINSINFGRIMLAIVHFVYLYIRTARHADDEITFAIPSGSFGNATACFTAQRMGLKCKILIVNNANDVTDRLIRTGTFAPDKNIKRTLAPAIDCQIPYNLQRIWYLLNRDKSAEWCATMDSAPGHCLKLPTSDWEELKRVFRSTHASDADVHSTIACVWEESRYLVDPHTAVAIHGARQYKRDSSDPASFTVVLSTAHPAKFPETVERAVGFPPSLPFGLRKIPEYEKLAEKDLDLDYPSEPTVASLEQALRKLVCSFSH